MRYLENDKLDCLIQLAYLRCGDKDAKRFDEIDDSEVVIPKSLDRKIKRLINANAHGRTAARTKRAVWRVAVAAMLIMSILFTVLISVSGIREAIWRAIVEWRENYITIRYEKNPQESQENSSEKNDNGSLNNTNSDSGEEASSDGKLTVTPPTSIEEVRKPTYVIEGAVEDEFKTVSYFSADYYVGSDMVYSFSQFIIKENKKYFDNQDATVEQIYVNEYSASLVIYSDSSEKAIVWNDGEYVYVLFSSVIDVEQMLTIAESVR